METIQIVLDENLLKAADRAARCLKINRSALFREALRKHLASIALRERERADRAGYERGRWPDEGQSWEKVAAWPEE